MSGIGELGSPVIRRVDVGGYELTAETAGRGAPAVVFISGCGDGREVWSEVLRRLQPFDSQVVTYCRPGIGDSDPLPDPSIPQTYGDAADELRRLLDRADIARPRVLVGHSTGAVIAQSYAMRWADEELGLVLVDPSDLRLDVEVQHPELTFRDGAEDKGRLYDVAAGIDELERGRLPLVPAAVLTSRVGRWLEADPSDWRPFTLEQLDERWQRGQRALADQLHALHLVAPTAGHYIHQDDPQLVTDAIRSVLQELRPV